MTLLHLQMLLLVSTSRELEVSDWLLGIQVMIFWGGNYLHLSYTPIFNAEPSKSRSTGYGSLQVWIRHLRQGITFQKQYVASDNCNKSGWVGSAFKVAGGYVWGEVYAEATKNNVVVVGGGDPVCGPTFTDVTFLNSNTPKDSRLYWWISARRRTFSCQSLWWPRSGSDIRSSSCSIKWANRNRQCMPEY